MKNPKHTFEYLTSAEGLAEFYEGVARAHAAVERQRKAELEYQRKAELERKITSGHDTQIDNATMTSVG